MTRIDIQRERKGKMLEVLHLFRCFTHTDTPSFFVTHHLSHTTLPHTTLFYFSILHRLPLSFLPSPSRYNMWCSLLEEVALWGYPVLSLVVAVVASAIFSAQRNSTLFLSLVLHQVIVSQPCTDCWYAADPARLQQKKLQSPNFPTVLVDRTLCMILESVSVFVA